jgi:membrane protein implicated in regulation of membrane protease activity
VYNTSLKTWISAIAIDGTLISALVAGIVFHVPYALEVSVFFLWWLSILGLAAGLILLAAASKTFTEQLKGLPFESKTDEEGFTKLWSKEMVDRFAYSNAFLIYHWLTDIAVWALLIIAGHPILAAFKVTSFLISNVLIYIARRMYRETKE